MASRRQIIGMCGALLVAGGGVLTAAEASAQTAPARKLKVVTTFTILQDMAQNVAGTAATVESITKPGAEIHDYQPTPLDVVKAQSADLVLWNGLNLERWFERFFENVKTVPRAVLTEGIEPLGIGEG
ncbi:MAG: metal ABC transporter solute-binding protein, Zn/Mn family, partial [Bosea sp. (in: a-proteobacteria)]